MLLVVNAVRFAVVNAGISALVSGLSGAMRGSYCGTLGQLQSVLLLTRGSFCDIIEQSVILDNCCLKFSKSNSFWLSSKHRPPFLARLSYHHIAIPALRVSLLQDPTTIHPDCRDLGLSHG